MFDQLLLVECVTVIVLISYHAITYILNGTDKLTSSSVLFGASYCSAATMWLHVLIYSAFNSILVSGIVEPGPMYPPTKGEVWPKAQYERKERNYFTFDPSQFQVKVTGQNCTILTDAIHRYSYVYVYLDSLLNRFRSKHDRSIDFEPQETYYQGNMQQLDIELTAPCEDYPHFEMDESYNLTVSATSLIKSASIWGILRGLETFAQFIYPTDDFKELRINRTQIVDFPRYAHRGLLLDTSRHFISLGNILTTLDAMAINKMNVFHWHIVDDQSFPYQSEKFPDLSGRGAYHPSMVYTKSNVETVIKYARDRGIRVIPEFDVPGHTRSWGVAYPNLLTECYSGGKVVGLGPMNPIRDTTYKLLRELIQEVQDLFPDQYLHVGGDEVEQSCWRSNPELQEYMRLHNINDTNKLHALFMQNVMPLLANRSTPIVWQEVFAENVPLSKDTLVQVWQSDWPITAMINVLRAGHRVIYSASWYLDHLRDEFPDYYAVDPRQMVYDDTYNITLAEGVVGGEACMWAEMADDRNFLSRVWPRASAVAERLWGPSSRAARSRSRGARASRHALRRVEEHACRMVRRGVPAQPPGGPGYCLA